MYAKYPLVGARGYSPYTRASSFHIDARFTTRANKDSFIGVIIEDQIGLSNLSEIVKNPFIDIVYIGVYDISVSLGCPGEVNNLLIRNTIEQICNVCKNRFGMKVGCMFHTSEELEYLIKRGVNFLVYKTDTSLLYESLDLIRQERYYITKGKDMKLSDYVMNVLVSEGVKYIFFVVGGGAMYLVDSMGRNKRIRYICNHHEQASVMSAEGYQRAGGGDVAVALVSTGPAATNALTGVCCAWNDSVPMLVISGQANSKFLIENKSLRQCGTHEVDIVSIVKPVTKYAVCVKDEKEIRYHLEKCLYIARNGRQGPVWLDIPLDVQQKEVVPSKLKSFVMPKKPKYDLKLEQITSMLKTAKRPIILIGAGVRHSRQSATLLKITKTFSIPVVTTKNALDIIEDTNPLLAGRIGINGQRAGNFAIQTADFILILGSRLPFVTTGYATELFGRNAAKVLVDIDDAQLNYCNIKLDLSVKAELEFFLPSLLTKLIKIKFHYDSKYWIDQCQQYRRNYPVITKEIKNIKESVNSYYFFDKLSDFMSPRDVLVVDQGAAFYSMTPAFRVKKGQIAFTNGGFSPMGYGLPAAVGACFSRNVKNVVCVHGDGGLQMNLQELQTVKHHNLSLKLFVFNNQGYLSLKHTQNSYFNGHFVGCDSKSGLSCPDIIKIAKAYGIKSYNVKNHEKLNRKLQQIMMEKGPVIVEVILDPLQPIEPKTISKRMPDGSMVSPPLEDMYPFLSREEYEQNKI
jgi:acetolactate synthase-1/2/3 large subunit